MYHQPHCFDARFIDGHHSRPSLIPQRNDYYHSNPSSAVSVSPLAFAHSSCLARHVMNPATQAPHSAVTMTKGMVMLFAFCCGAIVANIYYAQPIIGLIAPDIGLSRNRASISVKLSHTDYAYGLFC